MEALDHDTPSRDAVGSTPKQNPADHVGLFHHWLTAILLLGVFAFCVPTIPSADMWWHLSTGRYVIQNHAVPHVEPFSASIAGTPWTAHEWLSGVTFYLMYSLLGSAGPLLLAALVVTFAFWFAYQRSAKGPLLARILALALGIWATSPIFSVRPQIFTYLLASIFLFVLDRFLQGGSHKSLIVLPLLTIFWVNFHGGYMLGLTIILLFVAGALVEWFFRQADAFTTKRRVAWLLLACAACLLVVPLNPNRLALYTLPIATLKAWGSQTDILEWRSPDFHLSVFRPMAVLLLLTVAALALSPKRPRVTHVLLFLFFSYSALYSMRNLPFFVLVAFPLLAEHAYLPAWRLPSLNLHFQKAIQAAAVVLVAVVCAKIASDRLATELDGEQSRFPARAVSFLDAQKLPAPLFNSYDFGGYLIWRLYPRYQVYIDGRTELYGHAFLDKFIQVYQVNIDPRPALDQAGIRTVLVEPGSGLARFLRTQDNWKQVYEDPVAVIFTR